MGGGVKTSAIASCAYSSSSKSFSCCICFDFNFIFCGDRKMEEVVRINISTKVISVIMKISTSVRLSLNPFR